LQTVNILKDITWDYEHENAVYIPEALLLERGSSQAHLLDRELLGANRDAIRELLELARTDLGAALEYYASIPKQALTIRMFCLLPILFATATLRELEASTAMLSSGGSVKISRKEVRSLIAAGSLTTMSNQATRWLFAKTSRAPFALVLA
jgi:farnesyl-diphosphate farnesyltransferase